MPGLASITDVNGLLDGLFQDLRDDEKFEDRNSKHDQLHRPLEEHERDEHEDRSTTQTHAMADDRIRKWRAHMPYA